MLKYAVLFLGLLLAGQAYAGSECRHSTLPEECEDSARAFEASEASRHRDEYKEYVERTKPVQVITPDSSYLAYPSADGKTISVYGGTGRAFDRE